MQREHIRRAKKGKMDWLVHPDRSRYIAELERQNASLRKYKTNCRLSMRAMQRAVLLRNGEIAKLKLRLFELTPAAEAANGPITAKNLEAIELPAEEICRTEED